MRAIRSVFFIFIAFLFLGSVAGVDTAFAANDVAADSSVVSGSTGNAGVAANAEAVELSPLDGVPQWLQVLSLIISACAGIAAFTPTPKDDGVLSILRKVVDFLALNFGGARNAAADKNPSNRL